MFYKHSLNTNEIVASSHHAWLAPSLYSFGLRKRSEHKADKMLSRQNDATDRKVRTNAVHGHVQWFPRHHRCMRYICKQKDSINSWFLPIYAEKTKQRSTEAGNSWWQYRRSSTYRCIEQSFTVTITTASKHTRTGRGLHPSRMCLTFAADATSQKNRNGVKVFEKAE